MEKLVGVLLMAGLSTRFGGPKNKQLCLLNGKPVFSYSIDTFASSKSINELFIVVNQDSKAEVEQYLNDNHIHATLISGGLTRQESVENALKEISLTANDIIMIHDAARPLVDNEIINAVARAAHEYGASTTYLEATDTIAIKNENDEVIEFRNRSNVAQIQAPQAFRYCVLKEAHDFAKGSEATDDCTLVLKLGNKVKLVKGDKKFHKITTKEDIKYLEGLLN